MYTLYHHFLQKVKQEQVQRYNKKHRAYLIRSGKLIIQQTKPQISRNQKPQIKNRQNMRNIPNRIQKDNIIEQAPPVEAKPKRQRQFNRPGKNSQKDNQKQNTIQANSNQNNQQKPIRPARNNPKMQNFVQEAPDYIIQQKTPINYEVERPIKQNKLTPQQIEYLNQQKSKPIPQANKPSNQNQNRPPVIPPSQSINAQAPTVINDKKQRPLNQNKVNINQLQQQYSQVQLVECPTCGRKFRQKAFEKHESVCQKVFLKKRKPFEVKATDQQAQLLKKKSKVSNQSEADKKQAKQAKWKKQSQTFQNMIKRGRGQKVQVVQEDTRIQCPGCGRKFVQKSAERHIQFCTKKKRK